MTSVDTFMNESVSYFDSCSLIFFSPNCMYYHQTTLTIGLFLRHKSPFLVYFTRYSRIHRLYLLGTYQLNHWHPAWILLFLETFQTLPTQLSMWLICNYLQFLLLLFILEILLLYCYRDHYNNIHFILGSRHLHPRPFILPQKYIT